MYQGKYPDNWPAISRRIRNRDGWRCQWCGDDPPNVGVAHLNHEPMDCRDENLLTLCWRCHAPYDARTGANHPGKKARRLATRRENQRLKREATPPTKPLADPLQRYMRQRLAATLAAVLELKKGAESVKPPPQPTTPDLTRLRFIRTHRLPMHTRYTFH